MQRSRKVPYIDPRSKRLNEIYVQSASTTLSIIAWDMPPPLLTEKCV